MHTLHTFKSVIFFLFVMQIINTFSLGDSEFLIIGFTENGSHYQDKISAMYVTEEGRLQEKRI